MGFGIDSILSMDNYQRRQKTSVPLIRYSTLVSHPQRRIDITKLYSTGWFDEPLFISIGAGEDVIRECLGVGTHDLNFRSVCFSDILTQPNAYYRCGLVN